MEGYLTIAHDAEAVGEFVDRKSRFIAHLVHVESERAAAEHLSQIRAEHHDARHNVPAWILADGRERCSDDGEPQRTAGMPVLEVLRGADLRDVSCVVTRYFGGTLLGPGGLVRAYTEAAQQALQTAQAAGSVVQMTLVVRVVVQIPYAAYDRVVRYVSDYEGKVRDQLFAEDIQLSCVFRAGTEQAFMDAVSELMNGEQVCRAAEPVFDEF